MPIPQNHIDETKEVIRTKFKPIANVSTANGTVAAGATPTKAEFDAVVALANQLKTTLNSVLTELKK